MQHANEVVMFIVRMMNFVRKLARVLFCLVRHSTGSRGTSKAGGTTSSNVMLRIWRKPASLTSGCLRAASPLHLKVGRSTAVVVLSLALSSLPCLAGIDAHKLASCQFPRSSCHHLCSLTPVCAPCPLNPTHRCLHTLPAAQPYHVE